LIFDETTKKRFCKRKSGGAYADFMWRKMDLDTIRKVPGIEIDFFF